MILMLPCGGCATSSYGKRPCNLSVQQKSASGLAGRGSNVRDCLLGVGLMGCQQRTRKLNDKLLKGFRSLGFGTKGVNEIRIHANLALLIVAAHKRVRVVLCM